MNEKSASQLKQSEYLHALEEEETEFYEAIDPAQPSTSNAYRNEKFQYAHIPQPLNQPIAQHKSRLRALRQTSDAITEAAKKNGMQTVDRSGSRYVVPITMQAHPTQLNDYILPEKDDILSQNSAFPYCIHCHSIFKTWRGFEYHVLQIHLKPPKTTFFQLFKDFDVAKEAAAEQAFKQVFMMCRDGPLVTRQRVYEWEQQATREIMKFHFLKFKRPIVVTKKLPTVSREIQTELTSLRMMIPQILEPQQQLHHAPPIFQRLTMTATTQNPLIFQGYHISTPPLLSVGGRPRSTATQRDEDPRDREKRVAALMHAVTTSHNQ
ncbi:hypothetical protein B9Z55_011504 [Caenorhabditis nigoni]|uniref:Uncharacterized protein n=1 Tax=Caenorhabditis nigoni TaxID=1611254 RepID=A0A2G5UL97_9PELO|nr:hypothetical protein B9Z55_011504 [Caenorhabditis nigoni]